jgi:hypothetical protein
LVTLTPLTRALAFLGVEPEEKRGAALMTAHSFFMGCATVFFETAASATFLSRFSSSYLPWVYIAAAGVNTVTGTVYSRVQNTVSFARLMKGTLAFLLAIVVSVRAGLLLSSVAWVAFAGLVSYRIISSLTDLEYWAVASRIYDVRQAKRLFGLIGTGEVVARIAGSFSIPILVRLGGVSNLMVLSATALGLCLFLLGAVLRPVAGIHDPPKAPAAKDGGHRATAGVREILGNRYLALVVGVAVLATFGKYFVDFAFLEQMGSVGKGEEHLAALLGLFNGLTQTASLLTRLFVSRPLLHRFGIRVGVLVLPVLHAICAAATIVTGMLGAGAAIVFWFVIANQGIYKTFKHPIDNASFKVLYQPLKPEQRLAAQIAVEIIFSPVVVGVAGGIMLLFSAGMTYEPVRFTFVLLGNFIAWAVLARAAGRGYAVQLLETLRRRIEGNVTLPFDDATTLSVLRARLASESPTEVCVALSLLEKAVAPDLIDTLVAATTHGSVIVREHALKRLLELQPSALRPIRERISKDPEASIRCASVRLIVVEAGDAADDELAAFLADPDALVKRAAIGALYEINTDKARTLAETAIQNLSSSAIAVDRALGARLAGDHRLSQLLVPLLTDTDFNVRRAALGAAGKVREPALRAALVAELADPRFAQAAATALVSQGDTAIAELEPRFEPTSDPPLLRRSVHVFRSVGGRAGMSGLRRRLAFPHLGVRSDVIAALDHLGYSAEGDARDDVRKFILEEAREAAWSLGALRDLGDANDLVLLRDALEAERVATRVRLFQWLSFVHDRVTVHRVAAHIAHASKEKRAYAHEVLDLLLDGDDRAALLPLLEEAPLADRLARIDETFPLSRCDVNERLQQLVARSERWSRDWTRALAIRAAVHRGAAVDGVAAWSSSRDTIVRETANWALESERNETKDGQAMLLIEKVIMLKTVQMFAETSEERLAEIAEILEDVETPRGKRVFDKGDKGDCMYIVIAGSVRVFDGDKTLRVLGAKEIFGELALLDPEPRSASVEAIEDTRLFRLDGDTFSQLMAGNLEIVRGVLHVLCERLRRTSASAASV